MTRIRTAIVVTVIVAAAGGGVVAWIRMPQAPAPVERAVGWQELRSFSGETSMQTGSFVSDTGLLRIRWVTTPLDPSAPVSFKVTLHSAVSSRLIAVLVETTTAGPGTAALAEGLNISYFVVESSNLHWEFTADEGTVGVPARE